MDMEAVIDFERTPWKYAGAKDSAIRERFGVSSTVYYGQLNRLLDDPAALAYAPQLVRRLQRIRDRRRDARTSPISPD